MSTSLVVLAVAIAAGEVFVLRIGAPEPLPLSYALFPVVAVGFDAVPFAIAVMIGSAAGIGSTRVAWRTGARRLLTRVLVAAAVFVAYRVTFAAFDHHERVGVVIGALVAAALAAVAADEAARWIARKPSAFRGGGSLAWLALASSSVLMALGFRGVDGDGDLGLWGVALFATPLLAAWYSFRRLDAITRVARQTVDALSLAPEFGGLVPIGHAERVALLSAEVGRELRLAPNDLAALDTAARLHHLGAVTLDGDATIEFRSADVSAMTGAMLRDIATLAHPRSIIEGRAGLASAILRVTNTYDDVTEGDDGRATLAIERLRSAPAHAYDAVVVDALAVVVERRLVDRDLVVDVRG
jgi:hypothetical protein